ncbi:pyruvate dehydrogenase [acetyl-transferring]-phosphatase 1, mitochondrial-like [Latimeria chalumnae]|uniref:pyruvate dehydrogenase [acetyl-transferring]-phosphatase 1, mitochondrial-like n=1 Tax=Latimeria chalumnae TaxID=7897 RepID=UPI0003C13777|nr:PREDICTED: pyruvate dehydrogenase [acetyl-transferring]-phosphatase 1, mitochondrial-like [Latimeria chalumnae]XP_005994472.1 PREDICTED: pyruvate dehydrogenase [acetyl-transferring]-phosphatase 1, mitochondrial-like [Latimeria chalumnae]XP_005994473.1 PREDICTED: pyruvate dehydrogenase [acetyl-transferring]-phosphatase 1, mitochondrial-like [Latimeria chalumnae]XP_005994475.1 PREDICTED: pyruvate dehydrogenase [acetyl-transferring]-phosphatase 1, mitochondrial-like [Latimeria chalumnae]XP_0143|eukprot:XP_005994471.1 PREDICTED: pyruvate dehydrogenase [acetyl-transferring]-phosphatase 1, mitochondrial-like [Latimeria chalumnae]
MIMHCGLSLNLVAACSRATKTCKTSRGLCLLSRPPGPRVQASDCPIMMSRFFHSSISTRFLAHKDHSQTPLGAFQLSPAQVDAIIRANETTFKEGRQAGSVSRFWSNHLAANSPSEDRYSVATLLHSKGLAFGVFDGHAGTACARAVSERLYEYLAISLLPQKTLRDIEDAFQNGRPLTPTLHWHNQPEEGLAREITQLYIRSLRTFVQELLEGGTRMSVQKALVKSFQRLDADVTQEAQTQRDRILQANAIQVAFSGATACVAHVDGAQLHVANAGDSKAILGVQEDDGTWAALPLTRDHNAFNMSELRRLEEEHPNEDKMIIRDRLLGFLMPLRAFGDAMFKWDLVLQKEILQSYPDLGSLNIFLPPLRNYFTPPYLTAEPEVTHHTLRPQDKFLLLATDGLWDLMDTQDAVRLVGEHLGTSSLSGIEMKGGVAVGESDSNVATHLIRHAMGANEHSELDYERLAALVTLPEDMVRGYRDDITVVVIQFNTRFIESQQTRRA